jgi:hypothetical protein
LSVKQLIHAILQAAKGGGSSVSDRGAALEGVGVGASVGVHERAHWQPHWKIEKYHGEAKPENLYAVEEFEGNLLLNEGITELLNLLIGGTATPYNNANARIGVGDSTTAAAATQTGLQAVTNKTFKGMDATYPQVSNQTVTFRATFGATDANFSWQEFTVVNAADDTGKNLCRKVENHGTKASGDTWVVSVSITIS